MGHNIFIEDAAETNNIIEYNLLVQTMRSWSLLNTDQTPGSMWITHPDNIIRFNHAAGSDRYSYWYDLQDTAIGPSFDPNIPHQRQAGRVRGQRRTLERQVWTENLPRAETQNVPLPGSDFRQLNSR